MYSQAVVAVIAEVDVAAVGVDAAVAGVVAAVVLSNAIDVALLGGGYLLHYIGY